jgi:hypothetical protein
MKIGRIKELQHDLGYPCTRGTPMTDSRPAGESTVRRVTPHYCGVCGTEVACVSDLLSERDTRIARAEAELKDERLAFAHANEVVGKLEAELAQLQTAEATIRELDTENEELLQIIADCWAVFGLDSNREEEALPGVIQAQAAQLKQKMHGGKTQ